ncbi:MAG TPA: flagellar basal body P-ring protein FlgI [Bryobacteraceae bacterium]|nr:flagellar basal body P-ring protein FlgI [Bryobacteraceae bacterium]
MKTRIKRFAIAVLMAELLLAAPAYASEPAARLKELVSLEGVRENQLIGYGMVVGLKGTGDRQLTLFTAQSLANMLLQMGVTVNPSLILVHNVASVMVTATLPPFAQPGAQIDVTVGAIGDSGSLQGGLLLMTSLRGIDGQVYSIAQGPVVTGSFIAGGAGTTATLNHPTVGRIPNGAIVERPAPSVTPSHEIRLQLHDADFTTAARISDAVNHHFSPDAPAIAHADNSDLVRVLIPAKYSSNATQFIAELEGLTVQTDRPARVVVNERSGTIVMGKEVRVSPVAIMHGNLNVEIQTDYNVSQPNALASGNTVVTPQVSVGVKEEKARNVVLKEGATVEELVRALASIGSTPRDIIAILQSLHAAGALEAEIEVI